MLSPASCLASMMVMHTWKSWAFSPEPRLLVGLGLHQQIIPSEYWKMTARVFDVVVTTGAVLHQKSCML
ncbi:MAG: hypothetical protein ACK56F_18175, partial [bacterium]